MNNFIIKRSKGSSIATVIITKVIAPKQFSALEDAFFEAGYIMNPIESWAFTISSGCEERDNQIKGEPNIETAVASKIGEILGEFLREPNEL